MTEIFKFENQEVRFVGTSDNPWWIAKDVCNILEITDVSNALKNLDEDEKDTYTVRTPGGNQTMLVINESGLYSLILRSRKPEAKRFKKWLTAEVIPALRKTGTYSIASNEVDFKLANDLMFANYAALAAQSAGVENYIAEQIKLETIMQLHPDSQPLLMPQKNAIAASKPLPELPKTPTEIGQELAVRLGYVSVSAKKVNRKLLELGYQVSITRIKKSNGKEIHDYYQATEKGKPYSQLQMTAYIEGEGKSTKAQLRWFSSIVQILANNWEEN